MLRHVVTVINCIVGVSVLAMPFCFKQCGVVLASILLLLSGIMTRTVCYFLLKASTITRRRTYELLAYHTFGQAGKLVVEISIIGFLIGTLIAFLVVMGDLGPQILSDVFSIENNPSLRSIIMTALSLFVALPLGLLRNIDSLNAVSSLTMVFYVFLVCKILSDGMGPLWSGSFLTKINYWRPAGVLQCIPIFSMALSCQTQIFGIYDNLPEPSLQKMCDVIRKAINMCTFFYITVGFLGYIAFCTQNFGGNILLSFGPSWSTQVIKICFVMSIAFSFPLVIFPCRASLHSLVFKRDNLHHHLHDITTNYIPESRLKMLTVGIIMFTLGLGLLIPNIELVLGIVGSTTGSVICIIFPSIMFIRVTSKNTTERLLAQTVFCIGVVIMVVTTFVTLSQVNDSVEMSNSFDKTNIDELAVKENKLDDINIREPFNNPPILLDKNNENNKDIIDNNPSNQLVVEKVLKSEHKNNLDPPNNNIPTKNVTFTKLKSVSPHSELKSKLDVIDHEKFEVIQKKDNVKTPNEQDKHQQKEEETKKIEKIEKVDHQIDDLKIQEIKPNDPDVHNPDEVLKIPKKDETMESKKQNEDSKLVENILKENEKVLSHKVEVEKTINSSDFGNKKEHNQKKLKQEETLLKKLQEHEEQQKLLLAEQKAILEKLKQHQADDELKQQKNNKDLTNNNQEQQQKENKDNDNNNLNKQNLENQIHEKVILKPNDNSSSSIMKTPKRNGKESHLEEQEHIKEPEKLPKHESQPHQSPIHKDNIQNKVEISKQNDIQVNNDQKKSTSDNAQIVEKLVDVNKNENIIEKKNEQEQKKEESSVKSQSKIKVDRDI